MLRAVLCLIALLACSFLVQAGAPVGLVVCDVTEDLELYMGYGDDSAPITICGESFGNVADLEFVVAGGFPFTITEDLGDKLVVVPPADGKGKHLNVRVVSGNTVVGLVPHLYVTYRRPVVNEIIADPHKTRQSSTDHVIIYGLNFGTPGVLIHVTAWVGGFPCTNVHHVSDEEIRCTVTGFGANRDVVVVSNGHSSAENWDVGSSAVRYDFMNTVTPGFDCVPPFGSVDIINPDYCNCWSGSAPSDNLLSKECDIHAVCAGRITTQPDVAQFNPTRPLTAFENDKLWIKQYMPIVKNRRDSVIQFVVPALYSQPSFIFVPGTLSSPQCNYPGTLWAKKINHLDCRDEFYGSLPWSQHELCGFVEDKDPTITASRNRVWKSNLVHTYTETFKRASGAIYFRKVSHSFLVSVSFTRQVVVLTQTPVTVYIADEKAPTSIDINIHGDALYDVASKSTLIQFRSTMVWPYQIDTIILQGTWKPAAGNTPPGPVVAQAEFTLDQPGDYMCDQTQDTECDQSWILTINTKPGADPQVCNLKGLLEFNTDFLICRDYTTVGPCQGNPNTNFTISIGNTDLCDNAPHVDATAGLSASLESFYDAELNIPQTVFQTGDMVYFKLVVTDPSSTIDQVTFKEVKVYSSTDMSLEDQLFFITVSGADLMTGTFNTGAQFNITDELRNDMFVSPGDGAQLAFNFRLLRDILDVVEHLSSVDTDSITKQLTVEATIDILYHGNQKKRAIINAQSTTVPSKSHTQIAFYNVEADADELTPHNNVDNTNAIDESSNLFASSATSVVASFVAAVFCVVAALL